MFPMLAEDELHDLAEDIKAHGLLTPIVRDPDGVLLDGRNRLAACERAGVEPRFTTYDGTDQAEYIWLSNVRRRHISAGQRAMIQAMILSLSGHSLRTHAKLHDVSRSRLSLANTVLQSAADLAEQVRAGKLSLDAAAATVRERKAKAAAVQAAFDHLRIHAPDLAAQVTEGELALDAATRELGQRQAAVRRDQDHLTAIAERWDTLRELAREPDSLHTFQVLDGLTTDHRALVSRLIVGEAEPRATEQVA
ncbi:ParB/RepB/Spo0J family partition protein [Kitasatospora cineracea]|uniref:ParB/RepB/Spo0J family partition protein n=1 Tax=Kitasatospora cineracea TaxID=88074 RepID=UPI000F4A9A38|nr:ParB/RepB/Spo0J family partition protein [Kitasatospora cineracea]